MSRKKLWIIIGSCILVLLAVALTITLVLVLNRKKTITGITFESETVIYDGEEHYLEIRGELPEGVIAKYTNNGHVHIGIYEVQVHFEDTTDTYIVPEDMSATLTIVKASLSQITLEDSTIPYDGQEHSLAITGNLPADVRVSYENNSHKNVGSYEVIARFEATEDYEPLGSLKATLTIEPTDLNLDSIVFEDASVVYTGEQQFLYIQSELPEGITVEYENNGKINVGVYEITAIFTDTLGNYKTTGSKKANLTITKAYYNMEEVSFTSKIFLYDGMGHSLFIEGILPEGVSVEYFNNGQIELGEMIIIAKFNGDYENYYEIPDMEATITILKGIMYFIISEDLILEYNGSPITALYPDELPEGIHVSYENNVHTDVGEYDVIMQFVDETLHYEDMTIIVKMIIEKGTYDMSNVSFTDKVIVYDGNPHSLVIEGELPEGVEVYYSINTLTGVGQLEVTANFEVSNPENYNPIPPMTATLSIVPATLENVVLEDLEVPYDGQEHSLILKGELPLGVTFVYINNAHTEVGEYEVIVQFNVPNYKDLKATLRIVKADIDMSSISFNGETFVYDGLWHTIEITGVLPSYVEVSYENNRIQDVGSLRAVAIFKVLEPEHYNLIPNLYADLIVVENQIQGISFRGKTVTYDRSAHFLEITGTLPEGVYVSYEGNGQVNAGVYKVIAHFVDTTGNYEQLDDMEATLTILKANFARNGVIFRNATYTYNKEAHGVFIYCDDIPDDIQVVYENNNQTDAGFYEVKVFFMDENNNYNPVGPLTATLTILKAVIHLDHIVFENEYYTFDGFEHCLEIHGELPEEVQVVYSTPNRLTQLGRIKVTASFIVDEKNYEAIPSREAYLTITKGDLENVLFEDKTVTYTGTPQKIEVTGNIPLGITVEYTNNNQIDAGVYKVVADFIDSNGDYYNSLSAILTIQKAVYDMSGVAFQNAEFEYDGQEHKLEIKGTLPEGVEVRYTANTLTNAGQIKVIVVFAGNKNYEEIPEMTATLTIKKRTITGIQFESREFEYDGQYHSIYIEGFDYTLPIDVVYNNNYQRDVDEYEVIATFILLNSNYNPIPQMKATLKITPLAIEGITLEDQDFILDGDPHSLQTTSILPEGVYAVYENNEQIYEGEYEVRMTLAGEVSNYILPEVITATLRIYSDGTYHSVIFHLDENSHEIRIVQNGEQVKDYPTPKDKPGYDVSFNEDLGPITARTECYPIYLPKTFTISFDVDLEAISVKYLQEFELPIAEKENYTFKKWVDEAGNEVTGESYIWTEDITIYAVWQCMVTFMNTNEHIYEAITLESTDFVTPSKQYSSYLEGWYLDKEFELPFDLSEPVLQNRTLYAKYQYDFSYEVHEDEVEIIELLDKTKKFYSFLEKIEDIYPVIDMPEGLFEGCLNVEHIALPSLCLSFDSSFGALFGMTSYEGSIPVEQRGGHVFYLPSSLEHITLQMEVVPAFAFYNCSMIKEIDLYDVQTIEGYAFSECSSLAELKIHGNLKIIEEHAFNQCVELKIVICDSLSSWAQIHFEDSTATPMSYKAIFKTFDEEDVLSIFDLTGIETISDYQFYGFQQMKKAILPGVTTIGNQAFMYCENLSSIELGSLLENVSPDVFSNALNLEDVYFSGTLENWASICFENEYSTPMWIANNFYILQDDEWVKPTSLELSSAIERIGSYQFYGFTQLDEIDISNVTEIDDYAFSRIEEVNRLTLSNRLQLIKDNAFDTFRATDIHYSGTLDDWANITFTSPYSTPMQNDANIIFTNEDVDLHHLRLTSAFDKMGDYQFYGFKEIETVTIDVPIEGIGRYAFAGCTELTTITFSTTESAIFQDSVFSNSTKLKTIYYNASLEDWEKITFTSRTSTPLCNVGRLYINATELTEVALTKNPSNYQFYGIEGLEKAVLGENVNSIADYTFANCKSLSEVDIEGTIEKIGTGCFDSNEKLTSIDLSSVLIIPNSSFRNCKSLIDIQVSSIQRIDDSAFMGCSSLSSIDLSKITKLGSNAFYGCRGLTAISLDHLETIEYATFYGCLNLTQVKLSSELKEIKNLSFYGCTSLEEIILPESVQTIASRAFDASTSLVIYAEATSQPTGWRTNWDKGISGVYWYSVVQPEEGNYWYYGDDKSIIIW